MSGVVTCDKIVKALREGLKNATELEKEGICEALACCEDEQTPGEIVCEAFDEIIEVDEAPENGKVVFRTETGDCVVSELPEPKTPGEIVCEAFDEITEVDEAPEGAKVVVRDEDGNCFVSPAPKGSGGDSVVYNITELPEGEEAPKVTGFIVDMNTESEVDVPYLSGRLVAIGAGAEAKAMLTEMPDGSYEVWEASLAIGGSLVFEESSGTPQYVPALSSSRGIALFGQAEMNSIAIGNATNARYSSIAIGEGAEAWDGSVAFGNYARTTKPNQVSFAYLSQSAHLSEYPVLLSGVKTPEVEQDAANKEYVDNYIKTKLEAANITTTSSAADLIAVLLS